MSEEIFVPTEKSDAGNSPESLDAAETLMHSDRPLSPKMVSELLHVDVLMKTPSTHHVSTLMSEGEEGRHQDGYYVVGVIIASVLFSIILGALLLHSSNVDILNNIL